MRSGSGGGEHGDAGTHRGRPWPGRGAAWAAWLVALCLAGAPVAAGAEWTVDAAAGLEFDDNRPLAQADADMDGDVAVVASVSAGWRQHLDDATALTVTADLDAARHADFSGLDHVTPGATVALRRKLGLGFHAPWIRAFASIAHADFDDAQRDGWRYSAGAAIGRRFGERWSVEFGYAFERRRSDDVVDIAPLVADFGLRGDAYDTDAHRLSATVVYVASERLALVLRYARRHGEATATTPRGPLIFRVSDAVTPDPVFGPDRFAYRVEADTDVFGVAASWALGDHAAVDLGYERRQAEASGGFEYTNDIVELNVRVRY